MLFLAMHSSELATYSSKCRDHRKVEFYCMYGGGKSLLFFFRIHYQRRQWDALGKVYAVQA